MVVLWSWDTEILGTLENGIKVLITNVHGGWGDKQTITVDPIKAIYSYFPGIKDPGFSVCTFSFGTLDNSNIIYIQASDDADGSEIGIISFCV
jgi:hypothetical protein